MFSFPVLLVLTGVFTAIQIGVWQVFPIHFRDVLFSNTPLAFLVNLTGSNLILMFTGTASLVGVGNLGASVLFGAYAAIYKRRKGITGLTIKWNKLLNLLPVIPSIEVVYRDKLGALKSK